MASPREWIRPTWDVLLTKPIETMAAAMNAPAADAAPHTDTTTAASPDRTATHPAPAPPYSTPVAPSNPTLGPGGIPNGWNV
jgi:hypothetical protein